MDPYNKKIQGSAGEQKATEYLEAKGWQVECRNFRNRYGELDIICRAPNNTMVFVEVKSTRSSNPLGSPETWFSSRKIGQIKKMIKYYLFKKDLHNIPCRIDFMAVEWQGDECQIRHYENAAGF